MTNTSIAHGRSYLFRASQVALGSATLLFIAAFLVGVAAPVTASFQSLQMTAEAKMLDSAGYERLEEVIYKDDFLTEKHRKTDSRTALLIDILKNRGHNK